MPLRRGTSSSVVSKNIKELIHSNYPQQQAIAIAESEKRKSRKKKGK